MSRPATDGHRRPDRHRRTDRPRAPGGPRRPDEAGSLAVVQATWLLVAMLLVGLAALDVGALLKAARVAGAAADGAALAAATASRNTSPVPPRVAADRVARAHGARIDLCDCGRPDAHVVVTLPVDTRLLVHLGILEVRAEATATLVPRPDTPP